MATVRQIYEVLNFMAPFDTQFPYDNAGFLVGRGEAEVTRALISLDITEAVVQEAAAIGAQLIVAHHPVLFQPLKAVTDGDVTGRRLLALIESGVAAICAHTNLDAAAGGVNDVLAVCTGLTDLTPFGEGGIGRIGTLAGDPPPLAVFALQIKEALGAGCLRVVHAGRPVHRVAVVGGSGGSDLIAAAEAGCDTLLTGEVKYHHFLEAQSIGINLIEAGHYATEQIVCPVLEAWIGSAFREVEVVQTNVHKDALLYL